MDFTKQFEALLNNFGALDMRKKIGLGLAILVIVVGIITIGSVLNRPTTAVLYSNLTKQDVNQMSRILSENNIDFHVADDNLTISVKPASVPKSRMLLAEHGLPSSSESGYELFDKVNTLGLTSFMQDVTNKRAIQGELARTVQMIAGVKSARVHLVTPNKNIYRRNGEKNSSASLIIKTYGKLPNKTIQAIRHMIAAAIPGLETGKVTIINADGTLLTSKADDANGGTSHLIEMENDYEQEAEGKIASALSAYLGSVNFRVTVTAKLNNDKRRIDETFYDPESRIERSVQIVRESGTAENKVSSQPTTITQNLPEEPKTAGSGQSSSENKDKREETTNYEINTKKVSRISEGYQVETLSVALIVNKSRMINLLGANPDQSAFDEKANELKEIVRSSISMSGKRDDLVTVSFVEFLPDEVVGADPRATGIMSFINPHLGSIINAVGLILGALALSLLGVRPLIGFFRDAPAAVEPEKSLQLTRENQDLVAVGSGSGEPGVVNSPSNVPGLSNIESIGFDMDEVNSREEKLKVHLDDMVSQNEERVAMAIKQWLKADRLSLT